MSTLRHFLMETQHDVRSGVESWRLMVVSAGMAFIASIIAQTLI